ncbi:MAG: TetR family transcriptional regulator C-terminal domain-containing protein [Aggregatilineales bacterium]
MRKGEKTREIILGEAAELFNVQGYAGSSLADIMHATGLQKGGIYRHFVSKEALALEAFDYAFDLVKRRMTEALTGKRDPLERLFAIIQFFEGYVASPPLKGGCIILNTAIDSDDAHPLLRDRARQAMGLWQTLIRRTVIKGIEHGEMRPDLDPDEVATLIIGTIEGALMISKLYGDDVHIERAINHLLQYIEMCVKA